MIGCLTGNRTLDANRRGYAYAHGLFEVLLSKCVKHDLILPRYFVRPKNNF